MFFSLPQQSWSLCVCLVAAFTRLSWPLGYAPNNHDQVSWLFSYRGPLPPNLPTLACSEYEYSQVVRDSSGSPIDCLTGPPSGKRPRLLLLNPRDLADSPFPFSWGLLWWSASSCPCLCHPSRPLGASPQSPLPTTALSQYTGSSCEASEGFYVS